MGGGADARTPLGAPFLPRQIPRGDAASFLAAQVKGADDQNAWLVTGIVLIEQSARQLAPWVHDGEIEQVTESSSLLTMGSWPWSWSWTGLLAFVLRFDAPFKIVEPQAFIDAAEILSRRLTESKQDV